MTKRHVVGRYFEPFAFLWIALAAMLLWLTSASFRGGLKKFKQHHSRGNLTYLRLMSKRAADRDLPLVTPFFMLVGGVVGGLGAGVNGVAPGFLVGLLALGIMPVMFPTPSTLIDR